ncbi:alpha/beta hydrolase family protein [Luteimonas abyssi]|uniref:alpha/beta hydrolase family protein n=1 Tax=Luteimonas abyssi TaxID=1247514 RepID=UPI000737C6FB|nr:alpha/beta hydrolase [Luteimonas abyssi]
MSVSAGDDADTVAVEAADGHRFELIVRHAVQPRAALLWLPALGVAARHYLPFADALAAHGITVCLHEWRGHGSSNLRAGHACDWNYRSLLQHDLPAADDALRRAVGGLPTVFGGHSLGGQLASCHAGLSDAPGPVGLWLVASGAPWWRGFPAPLRYTMPAFYRFMPWLANRRGALPGRTIGFGGNEARGVIRDWAACGLSGRYAAHGWNIDLEARLRSVRAPVMAVVLSEDRLGPASSLRVLLDKLGSGADARIATVDSTALGARADHFAWMRSPGRIADILGTAPG